MKRVVIIGGGIGGLTTAIHLLDGRARLEEELEVLVLEGSQEPGGNIRTDRLQGFTIEKGPNGFLDNVPTTPALVRRLGIEGRLQPADASAAKRYLFRDGRLHLLPSGPLDFFKSPVLSLSGRLRVLAEPFARPRPPDTDESVFDFAARRIGEEAASVLIDAMVSGVFAGDVRELSLASCFPKMAAMEEEHGGLMKAMLARMKERRGAKKVVEARRARGEEVQDLVRPGGPAGPGGTLTSFEDGLDTLPGAAAKELGDALSCGTEVVALRRDQGESSPAPWAVQTDSGRVFHAHAVVAAIPSRRAFPLLRTLDPALALTVSQIKSAGLAVVALAYDAESVGGGPDGFGFLVPRGTGPRILGCLWDSSIFPGRAPEGKVLMRVMIGGAHDPEAVELPEEGLVEIVRRDLNMTMGLEVDPLFTRVYRWPLGIGQYTLGHQDRLDRIHERLSLYPGLWLAGSSFYGISMNACIEKAGQQAQEVLEFLAEKMPLNPPQDSRKRPPSGV